MGIHISDEIRRVRDIEVVGEAGDGRTAIERVEELRPDVVIMDIEMPCLDGIEATRQIMVLHPDLKILALSAHSEGNMVYRMINAGARGYMHKESAFSELKEGIRTMLEGETFLCSRISKVVISKYLTMMSNPDLAEADGLNTRERKILRLIAEGYSTKDIAERLKLHPKR